MSRKVWLGLEFESNSTSNVNTFLVLFKKYTAFRVVFISISYCSKWYIVPSRRTHTIYCTYIYGNRRDAQTIANGGAITVLRDNNSVLARIYESITINGIVNNWTVNIMPPPRVANGLATRMLNRYGCFRSYTRTIESTVFRMPLKYVSTL